MRIYFKKRGGAFPAPIDANYPYLILQWDNWNDYSYYTLFRVYLQLADGPSGRREIGSARVMRKGQQKFERPFQAESQGPVASDALEGSHCSLSSEISYYETLAALGSSLAVDVLTTLQDASFLPEVRATFENEPCFRISLLRDSDARRLLDEAGGFFGVSGRNVLKFRAAIKLEGASAPHEFDFDFGSAGPLSRRIHALVGLNGVGKTQILARFAMLLSRFSRQAQRERRSALEGDDRLDPVPSIYNVVAISFSAFDQFERPTEKQGEEFSYSYCGLRTQKGRLRSEEELLADIRDLIAGRLDGRSKDVLVKALERLVKVDDLRSFVFESSDHAAIYARLSAGQRIVLNSLCHLLSKISNGTLVLFDEPELHLHPQLLTGMMSALSSILIEYESFAILATHSPIVIQELPRSCVHVVRRDRMTPMVYNPDVETFGENLSEITRNVFVATDSDRDYRSVLQELLARSNNSVDTVLEIFGGRLSLNARIFLESLRRFDGVS